MAIGKTTTLRNAQLNLIRDGIDAGSGQGKLKIYSGTRPATGAAIGGATLLGTLLFSATSAANASGGVLTFSGITSDTNADATGTAAWARITDSDDNFVMDASVGSTGSGADVELSSTSITSGGTISCTSATITAGGA